MTADKEVHPSETGSDQEADYRISSRDGRLVAEFRWGGDRFNHRLLINGEVVGQSIEGDGSLAWPPSPPIQQISLESINGQDTVLGVGGAGRGHWSISADGGNEASDASSLCFDVACRVSDLPEFLGSSYRTDERLTITASIGDLNESDGFTGVAAHASAQKGTFRWAYRVTVS